MKCAVGCLIPDFLYNKKMENHTIGDVFELFPELKSYLQVDNGGDLFMIQRLQMIHDSGEVKNWNSSLKEFAASNGLDWKFEGEKDHE